MCLCDVHNRTHDRDSRGTTADSFPGLLMDPERRRLGGRFFQALAGLAFIGDLCLAGLGFFGGDFGRGGLVPISSHARLVGQALLKGGCYTIYACSH